MSEHGFERVDKILVQLAAEMDASMEKQMCRRDTNSGSIAKPAPSDPECVVDGQVWVRRKNLNDLFEQMNARFEIVARRLRLSDRRIN